MLAVTMTAALLQRRGRADPSDRSSSRHQRFVSGYRRFRERLVNQTSLCDRFVFRDVELGDERPFELMENLRAPQWPIELVMCCREQNIPERDRYEHARVDQDREGREHLPGSFYIGLPFLASEIF
jgi:hypothetical protein